MNNNFRYRNSLNVNNPNISNRDAATSAVKNYDGGTRVRNLNTLQGVDPTIATAMGYMSNPNVKPSGAPVPFSPASTKTMNSAFGMPIDNSYDRSMALVDPTQTQDM